MADCKCPFCSVQIPLMSMTYRKIYLSFDKLSNDNSFHSLEQMVAHPNEYIPDAFADHYPFHHMHPYTPDPYDITVHFFKCPSCEKIHIRLSSCSDELKSVDYNVYPNSLAIQFPNYVPETIRSDYMEAYSIVSLSPKASATLARRCLQGIIRDFWNISGKTLYAELTQLESKISPSLWKTIDCIREIGNIGAHPEKDINTIVDVEPNEAEKILKLIELLIKEWYIQRHEQEQLFNDIQNINSTKQEQRRS